uniref:Uncharacterized protein n=1 Tax=Tetraselmis sp. GSL018 TaxID=582737 RepID=A0A061QUE2_9CHLO
MSQEQRNHNTSIESHTLQLIYGDRVLTLREALSCIYGCTVSTCTVQDTATFEGFVKRTAVVLSSHARTEKQVQTTHSSTDSSRFLGSLDLGISQVEVCQSSNNTTVKLTML